MLFTLLSVGSLINMFQKLSQPYAPRIVVKRDGTRVRQGTLGNVMDSTGATWGFCMMIGMAALLWLI